jgi:hypothetical protein
MRTKTWSVTDHAAIAAYLLRTVTSDGWQQ